MIYFVRGIHNVISHRKQSEVNSFIEFVPPFWPTFTCIKIKCNPKINFPVKNYSHFPFHYFNARMVRNVYTVEKLDEHHSYKSKVFHRVVVK